MKRFTSLFLAISLCLSFSVAQAPTAVKPATTHISSFSMPPDQGNPDVKVWVNTTSGVYHCPGTRWYGTTKRGEYMKQAEAQKKGYRPAYGKVCR